MSTPILGVLGGLGPLATVDFLAKLVELTPAACDQEHIPWAVVSLPQTPDRTRAILHGGESPLPYLESAVRRLNGQGVAAIAILCNTAHHWYDELQQHSRAPILHIADAAIAALAACAPGTEVGILATRGTISSGFYQRKLSAAGFTPLVMCDVDEQDDLDECIRLVKAHQVPKAAQHLKRALEASVRVGCRAAIMACTEIPVAYSKLNDHENLQVIDANLELARTCVEHFRTRQTDVPVAHPA
jgi:aspartate racemase